MDDLVENLKKIASEYAKHLVEVREKIRLLEDVPKAKALVGKCFKYQNSYGPNEKWWLYTKVIKAVDGEIEIDEFQEDTYGKIEFVCGRSDGATHFSQPKYISISEEEYFVAYEALVKKVIKKGKRRI